MLHLRSQLLCKTQKHIPAQQRRHHHVLLQVQLAPLVAGVLGIVQMRILLVVIVVVLLLGPFRRPYLRHARFSIPATIGCLAGLGLGMSLAAKSGLPPVAATLLMFSLAFGFAIGGGEAVKNWCDKVFGKREKSDE